MFYGHQKYSANYCLFRYQALFADRWPKKIGLLQLVTGFFTAIIGKFSRKVDLPNTNSCTVSQYGFPI